MTEASSSLLGLSRSVREVRTKLPALSATSWRVTKPRELALCHSVFSGLIPRVLLTAVHEMQRGRAGLARLTRCGGCEGHAGNKRHQLTPWQILRHIKLALCCSPTLLCSSTCCASTVQTARPGLARTCCEHGL